jgi:hypothetical protein
MPEAILAAADSDPETGFPSGEDGEDSGCACVLQALSAAGQTEPAEQNLTVRFHERRAIAAGTEVQLLRILSPRADWGTCLDVERCAVGS